MPETPSVDLTNCDREPIHIPGAVQPHGVLLVLDDSRRLVQVSRSIAEHLGVSPAAAVGKTLHDLIDKADADDVLRKLDDGPLLLHPLYLRAIRAAVGWKIFDAIAHRSGGHIILELEPADPADKNAADLHRLTQTAVVELRAPGTLNDLCDCIARHVRRLNGFDRVMVYRFDGEWNGQVIAEAKAEHLEPFLGLHYPASDIPRQARELYTKNWLRFIADRDYAPSTLVPARLAGDKPLDMSFSVLRSVSPIHIEYLRNMGVGASMSISLVEDGKLWGLIACHHYSPRRVPFAVRTACELLAQVMSLQVVAREQAETSVGVRRSQAAIGTLVGRMDAGEGFADSLTVDPADLLDVVQAGGAAVVDDRHVVRVGQTPGEARVLEIVDTFAANAGDVIATDNLSAKLGIHALDPVASGVLIVRPTRLGRRWVLFFRGEQVRTVHWAGDPAKTVHKGDAGDEPRLSPRGSFALWKQTVIGRSRPWTAADLASAEEIRREMQAKVLAYTEDLVRHNVTLRRSREESEQQLDSERAARSEAERLSKMKDEFVATLSHELRTPLTAIQGWAQLLRSTQPSGESLDEGLEIIERNARAQAQMVEDLLDMSRITSGKLSLDVQSVQLPQVVDAAVAAVKLAADAKGIRLQKTVDPMTGVNVTGDPHRLQQVLWNLLNNAMKFTPKGGRVAVVLKRVASHVEMSVSDSGIGIPKEFLPHVFDRFRQADGSHARHFGGLGLGLSIVRNLVELHGGTVSVESPGQGSGTTFAVTLPLRAVVPETDAGHPRTHIGGALDCDDLNIAGIRVLVVDDEPDTRELVCRVLTECSVVVTAAHSAADAMEKLAAGEFDVMVSDIGMPGEDGYSLIKRVREREAREGLDKMPAIALTAYARAQDRQKIMLAGFQVHVAKPVEAAELMVTVASLAGRV